MRRDKITAIKIFLFKYLLLTNNFMIILTIKWKLEHLTHSYTKIDPVCSHLQNSTKVLEKCEWKLCYKNSVFSILFYKSRYKRCCRRLIWTQDTRTFFFYNFKNLWKIKIRGTYLGVSLMKKIFEENILISHLSSVLPTFLFDKR